MLGRRGRLVVATVDFIFATVVVKYGQLLSCLVKYCISMTIPDYT